MGDERVDGKSDTKEGGLLDNFWEIKNGVPVN